MLQRPLKQANLPRTALHYLGLQCQLRNSTAFGHQLLFCRRWECKCWECDTLHMALMPSIIPAATAAAACLLLTTVACPCYSWLLLLLLLLLLPRCLPGAVNSAAVPWGLTRKLKSMPRPNVMPKPMALCSTSHISDVRASIGRIADQAALASMAGCCTSGTSLVRLLHTCLHVSVVASSTCRNSC
jgi:hypothetical protein